jgi:putative transposase
VERAREQYGMTERHACRLLEQWRGTQRYASIQRNDEDVLTRAIVTLATKYGRYGYRRITALLRSGGWQVGKDRVQRIWRREGLKVPKAATAKLPTQGFPKARHILRIDECCLRFQ